MKTPTSHLIRTICCISFAFFAFGCTEDQKATPALMGDEPSRVEASKAVDLSDYPEKSIHLQEMKAKDQSWIAVGEKGYVTFRDKNGAIKEEHGITLLEGKSTQLAFGSSTFFVVNGPGESQLVKNSKPEPIGKLLSKSSDPNDAKQVIPTAVGALYDTTTGKNEPPTLWLIGSKTGRIGVFTKDGTLKGTIIELTKPVAGLSFNPDANGTKGRWVVVFEDGTFNLIDYDNVSDKFINQGQQQVTLSHGDKVVGVAYDATTKIWWVFTTKSVFTINGTGTPSIKADWVDLDALGVLKGTDVVNIVSQIHNRIYLGTKGGNLIRLTSLTDKLKNRILSSAFGSSSLDEAVVSINPAYKSDTEIDDKVVLLGGENGSACSYNDSTAFSKIKCLTFTDGPIIGIFGMKDKWNIIQGRHSLWETYEPKFEHVLPKTENKVFLGGKTIYTISVGESSAFIGGAKGSYQLISTEGEKITEPATVEGETGNILGSSYTGSTYVAVTSTGTVVIIDPETGKVTKKIRSDINLLSFASWNGTHVLVGGGEQGRIFTAHGDAATVAFSLSKGNVTLTDATDVVYSVDNQDNRNNAWLIIGTSKETTPKQVLAQVDDKGEVTAINQLKGKTKIATSIVLASPIILIGDSKGLVEAYLRDGSVLPSPAGKNLFNDLPITAMNTNTEKIIAAGEFGYALIFDTKLAVGSNDRSHFIKQGVIHDIAWSEPIGFPKAPCQDSCFGEVVCINKRCCDSACSGACQSCYGKDTGKLDGECAPIKKGKAPKKAGACKTEDSSTCGNIGVCDGSGKCEKHDSQTVCAPSACLDNRFYAAITCVGDGSACASQAATECQPYAGCDPTSGCPTSCTKDEECITDYICKNAVCVKKPPTDQSDQPQKDPNNKPPTDTEKPKKEESAKQKEGGCSSTGGTSSSWVMVLGLGLGLVWRRRRHSMSTGNVTH